MAKLRGLLKILDGRALVRDSRFRFAGVRARGVAAILCGAGALVLAAGASRAISGALAALPETVREVRLLWLAVRGERRELPGA